MGIKWSRNDIRNVYKQYSPVQYTGALVQQYCSGTIRYERKGHPWWVRVRSKTYEYSLTQLHYRFQLDRHIVPRHVAHPIKTVPVQARSIQSQGNKIKRKGAMNHDRMTADCELLPETVTVLVTSMLLLGVENVEK